MLIEAYKKNNYSIEIGYDEADFMFEDLWHNVSFISNHKQYDDQGDNKHLRLEDILNNELPENLEATPVYAYIHGGIALSLGEFGCRFDSGCFGFLITKKGQHDDESLKSFVELWDNILNNNVYYFHIYDDNNTYDCCGGFTDMDDLKAEIDCCLTAYVNEDEKRKVSKLKTLIKKRVPLHLRANILKEVA